MSYWFRKPLKKTETFFISVFSHWYVGQALNWKYDWQLINKEYHSLGVKITKLQESDNLLN